MPHPALTAPDNHTALIALLDRIGGRVPEEELRYQIDRHGLQVGDLLGELHDLEAEGLVCGVLQFELTAAGRAAAREGAPAPA